MLYEHTSIYEFHISIVEHVSLFIFASFLLNSHVLGVKFTIITNDVAIR